MESKLNSKFSNFIHYTVFYRQYELVWLEEFVHRTDLFIQMISIENEEKNKLLDISKFIGRNQ
jgi:hypothetical protein